MEPKTNNVSERILQLTLEIIYLLTGEDNIVVKKTLGDGQDPITVPLHSLRIPEKKDNDQKIVEVTKKIVDLLKGESGNWNNFVIGIKKEIKGEEEDGVMKQREYLEGHKDLYKDAMMGNQPPLTSPDGSRNRNAPERCPRPLGSQDSTHEDHTIPQHHQREEMMGLKIVVKEEEETSGTGDSLYIKDEMMETITNEESSLDVRTRGHNGCKTPEGHLVLSADYNKNGQSFIWKNDLIVPQRFHNSERPYLCSECEKTFKKKSKLIEHMRIHTGEKPFSCWECGKAFTQKSLLNRHHRVHTGEKPFSCSVCGKCFHTNGNCITHMRIHTGEKPYSCSKCGRCFSDKRNCDKHTRRHIGEKLLACPECGKCFKKKVELVIHQNTHTA